MSFFVATAQAQTAGAAPPGQADWPFLIMMVGLCVFFYFIAIRPARAGGVAGSEKGGSMLFRSKKNRVFTQMMRSI